MKTPNSLTDLVLNKLTFDDTALSGLRDHHFKTLLEFTKFFFSCPKSIISIGPDKKTVYLIPIGNNRPLPKLDFERVCIEGRAEFQEEGLPVLLNVEGFKFRFKRTIPRHSKTI